MNDKEKALEAVHILSEHVRSDCALESDEDPWKLLVMARLSAQCTDARVNAVCADLFRKYKNAAEMAASDIHELEEAVKSCGLYRTKAANLKDMSQIIAEKYGGMVPSDMDELLALPGVGRKIANLIRGDVYGLGGIVADTHCIRICGRLGFYPETLKDAVRVEKILTPLIPKNEQTAFCHRIVWFGRDVCCARSPKCGGCPLSHICSHYLASCRSE